MQQYVVLWPIATRVWVQGDVSPPMFASVTKGTTGPLALHCVLPNVLEIVIVWGIILVNVCRDGENPIVIQHVRVLSFSISPQTPIQPTIMHT